MDLGKLLRTGKSSGKNLIIYSLIASLLFLLGGCFNNPTSTGTSSTTTSSSESSKKQNNPPKISKWIVTPSAKNLQIYDTAIKGDAPFELDISLECADPDGKDDIDYVWINEKPLGGTETTIASSRISDYLEAQRTYNDSGEWLIFGGCQDKQGSNVARVSKIISVTKSSSTSSPTPPPSPVTGISENTKILDDLTIENLFSIGENSLAFSQSTTQLSSLKTGDIIVSGKNDYFPNGLFRKVVSVSNGGKTIGTSQASLEDAVKEGSFALKKTLTPSDIGAIKLRKGMSLTALDNGFDFNVELGNVVIYDLDGDESTIDDQITANGAISFNLDFDFNLTMKDYKLKNLLFKEIINEKVQLELNAPVPVSDFAKKMKILEFNNIPSYQILLPTTPPFPIVIKPKVEINVGLEGRIFDTATANVTQNATLTAGLSYDKEIWTPISNFSNDFEFETPKVSENANLKVYGGPRLNLLFYYVAGPFVEVNDFAKLNAEKLSWTLSGGLEVNAGVKMEVLSRLISDYGATVIEHEEVLKEGRMSHPAEPKVPTVVLIQPGPEGKDAVVMKSVFSDSNCSEYYDGGGEGSLLEVHYDSWAKCSSVEKRVLLEFPLNAIPKNAVIDSAKLWIYGYATTNYIGETPTFYLAKLNSTWKESSVSCENKPDSERIGSEDIPDGGEYAWHSFDATEIVQDWINGEPNYGFEIYTEEKSTFTKIYSSDNSDAEKRPKLEVSYYAK